MWLSSILTSFQLKVILIQQHLRLLIKIKFHNIWLSRKNKINKTFFWLFPSSFVEMKTSFWLCLEQEQGYQKMNWFLPIQQVILIWWAPMDVNNTYTAVFFSGKTKDFSYFYLSLGKFISINHILGPDCEWLLERFVECWILQNFIL